MGSLWSNGRKIAKSYDYERNLSPEQKEAKRKRKNVILPQGE
jgi:hypothetical protein